MRGLLALGICPIAMADDECGEIIIVSQPQSTMVEDSCRALFSVEVEGEGPFVFQWYRDGEAIPGATEPSYTTPHLGGGEDGSVHVVISNGCSEVVSERAWVTISMDNVPPQLRRARGDESLERVIVTFSVAPCGPESRLYEPSAEEADHYSIDGGLTVIDATLDEMGTNVVLTTSRQIPGKIYRLAATGVRDLHGDFATNDTEFQAWVVSSDGETVEPPPVTVEVVGGVVWVDWPEGSRLQEAENAAGPWELISEVKPFRVEESASVRFYRAVFVP